MLNCITMFMLSKGWIQNRMMRSIQSLCISLERNVGTLINLKPDTLVLPEHLPEHRSHLWKIWSSRSMLFSYQTTPHILSLASWFSCCSKGGIVEFGNGNALVWFSMDGRNQATPCVAVQWWALSACVFYPYYIRWSHNLLRRWNWVNHVFILRFISSS